MKTTNVLLVHQTSCGKKSTPPVENHPPYIHVNISDISILSSGDGAVYSVVFHYCTFCTNIFMLLSYFIKCVPVNTLAPDIFILCPLVSSLHLKKLPTIRGGLFYI